MKVVVLGAGRMGAAAASDLAMQEDVSAVVVVDRDPQRANAVLPALRGKGSAATADLADRAQVRGLFRGAKGVFSAASYSLNLALTECAIEARAHFVDLGGNNSVVRDQLALDSRAKAGGISVIPDCGLAPGLAGWLGTRLANRLDRCESLALRVGGLPSDRPEPLQYRLVFSVEGLINEYKEPCLVVRAGRTLEVEAMTETEALDFPPPFGRLECFHTSGGLSTLPQSLAGRVANMEYKTIRYPGHAEKIRLLFALGLADERPLVAGGVSVAPRKVLEACLERTLSGPVDDVVLVQVEAVGDLGGMKRRSCNRIIDRADRATGHSAMARTTAYPAAIALLAAMRGHCPAGVVPGELALDLDDLLREVRGRGIAVEEWESPA